MPNLIFSSRQVTIRSSTDYVNLGALAFRCFGAKSERRRQVYPLELLSIYYICNMNADLNINTILTQVKQLDRTDQLSLLGKLALLIRKSDTGNKVKLSSISGIGSSLWSRTNIDEYIEQERQW